MTVRDSKVLQEGKGNGAPDPAAPKAAARNGGPSADGPRPAKREGNIAVATGRKNPWVSVLVWLVVLAVLAGGGWYGWRFYEQSQKKADVAGRGGRRARGPAPVVVEKSRRGNMPIYINRVGTVMAFNTVTLRSRVDGQLEKVAFDEGQFVKQGELLFKIDPRPYQVQLMQAQGQMAKDEATLNNARVDLKRYQAAAEAISEQQLATAEAAVKSAEGVVKADQGAIEAAKLNITYCTINAPISGKIGLRMVDVGNMVHSSDTKGLAVITQLDPISVIFAPPQDDLPRVEKAMSGKNEPLVEAWDRTNTVKLATGKVAAIENQIDPTTATFKIKAVFDNKDGVLYPNQFVNVRLLIETLEDVVLVPDAAIQQSPTSDFVYVVGADKKVEMREVKTGPSEKGLTVVESGLKPDEVVVTAGVDKLEPKMEVVAHFAEQAGSQPAASKGPSVEASGASSQRASHGASAAAHDGGHQRR
jgi:multidrug efflux system membrane fusion protein